MTATEMFDQDGNLTPAGMAAFEASWENAENSPLIGADPAPELS